MSSDAGDRPDPTEPLAQPESSPEFTVPLPQAGETQAIPEREPTRVLPPPSTNPYAGQPVWPSTPAGGSVATTTTQAPDELVDPLLGQIGVALFWITVGWWVFFLVRLLGYFVRFGGDGTIVIRTIDLGAEETILAAVLSVIAAVLLLFGRGSRGRSPLGYASAALAIVTVGVAVWRILP